MQPWSENMSVHLFIKASSCMHILCGHFGIKIHKNKYLFEVQKKGSWMDLCVHKYNVLAIPASIITSELTTCPATVGKSMTLLYFYNIINTYINVLLLFFMEGGEGYAPCDYEGAMKPVNIHSIYTVLCLDYYSRPEQFLLTLSLSIMWSICCAKN